MAETADLDISFRKVAINDVTVGMFIGDVFDRNGTLLLSANVSVQNEELIARLKSRGVTSVFIDIARGKDIESQSAPKPVPSVQIPSQSQREPSPREREQAYYVELDRAREIHEKTVFSARHILQAIRSGKSFSTDDLQKSSESMVESVLRNPDALVSLSQIKGYDEYTYTHSVNVGILVTSLAYEMGYDGEKLVQVGMGGLLHDIGKMLIPERILNKPGKLTPAEFAVVKRHPERGIDLLSDKTGIADISKAIVIQHHERYNGNGYPAGLAEDEIHEVGLISAIADVYDALTSDRVYKEAWTPQRALALIFQGCDRDYSRTIVERFTKHLGIYPVGSFVKLVSGEMGVVIRVDKGRLLFPTVLILFDEYGKKLLSPRELDLAAGQEDDLFGDPPRIEISLNPKNFKVNIADFIQSKVAY